MSQSLSLDDFKSTYKEKFEELYNEGIDLFENSNIRDTLKIVNFPTFNTWYDSILSTEGIVSNNQVKQDRLRKINQYGNFGVSQPSGGFDINVTKEQMIENYEKAISGDLPILMVITEPFSVDFLEKKREPGNQNGKNAQVNNLPPAPSVKNARQVNNLPPAPPVNKSHYRIVINNEFKCGLFYNAAFDASFTIVEMEEEPPIVGTVTPVTRIGRVNWFKVTKKDDTNPIYIANWHGNSDGAGGVAALAQNMEWAKQRGIHFLCGDSNITEAKSSKLKSSPPTIGGFLSSKLYTSYYCKSKIAKQRSDTDIFLNNQIEKNEKTEEPDGMFIVDLTTDKSNSQGKGPDTLEAFKTPYSKETPILADHSVIEAKAPEFTLLAATGTTMDDPQRGLFGKPEWLNVDIGDFHKKVGRPYTKNWIEIYNKWADSFTETGTAYDFKATKLKTPVMTGGARSRKRRKSIKSKNRSKRRKRTSRSLKR